MKRHRKLTPLLSAGCRAVVGCAIAFMLTTSFGWGATQSPAFSGHWEGALSLRGAQMPVRIHLEYDADTLLATLDIPSLIMAWEPIPATPTNNGARLDFPFGLGELVVELKGDEAHAAKAIGEDTLALNLTRALPPPFRREDVHFTSGGTKLVGTLVAPYGDGPHPAVVLLHGSGRQGMHKWEYRSWADLLARQGLAVLYYDKRGVGSSEGEYGASLRQLADDGLAAVRYLRSQPEVDPRRIGLRGLSEGAWVAEQIAADLNDMAFLILISAAAGTPRTQEFQKIEYGMRSDGRSEAAIEDAMAYMGLYFYVARTGDGWALLEEAIRRAQSEEWGQYVDQPRSQADLAWWHENHAFQPASVVESLDLPVLMLYGGDDWITPPVENGNKLKHLFPSPERVELHVFPGADHRLEIAAGRDTKGLWQWPRNGATMQHTVAKWLAKNGFD